MTDIVAADTVAVQGSGIPTTMRAAVLFGPGDLRVIDKPVPRPGAGEVLVKVAMCGTCGSDLRIRTRPSPGQPPFGVQRQLELPTTTTRVAD
jgi:hypothetical protein